MIYTVTLNPSLDITLEVEELVYDDVNGIVKEKKRAAGKGIDVSRVIKELGGQSIVLGFAGGYNGLELEGRLLNEGVLTDFTRIHEETKTNITIFQRKKKIQTLLSVPEPTISPLEIATFYHRIKEIPKGSYVVVSGNPPLGVNEYFYGQIIMSLKEKGARVVLDADKTPLKNGVSASPYVIKPNIHEFGRLVGKNIVDVEEILEYAKLYQHLVPYIVVSMGARGTVGISQEGNYYVVPPKVKVRNSIGAGDSLVAGVLFALSEAKGFEEALVLGVACGTASTLNRENGLCLYADVENIHKDIVVKNL
jgi:6-phosphofructokinase 2